MQATGFRNRQLWKLHVSVAQTSVCAVGERAFSISRRVVQRSPLASAKKRCAGNQLLLQLDLPNMVQLEELYEELLGRLPTEPETNLTLSAANCARPPDEVETQNLKVLAWRLGHDYGDCARYDVVEFFADTASYQRFGLLLFASVCHPNRQVTLHPSPRGSYC